MKNKYIYTQPIKHIICAYLLLCTFVFISLAQALHAHDVCHNDSNNVHNIGVHISKASSVQVSKTCEICQYNLSKNQGDLLPVEQYFNVNIPTKTLLLHTYFVAFYVSKHLSLFSGNSPPKA
ncbi:MAG: hypothetical protein EAZ51_08890 [Sphingobacteriales bacterium]|nr:MAG: hypothetical protein EAZ64_04080 [Sphingobacteriales bacterium]TAF78755.1 MAG: hypothetical protein EAZ51_08890 [Sphingobacteriales bacterium]